MSVQSKAEAIKELLVFIVSLVPKIFDVVSEIISLIKELKTA